MPPLSPLSAAEFAPEIGAETAPGSCGIPPTAICPHAPGGLTFRRHSGASRNLTFPAATVRQPDHLERVDVLPVIPAQAGIGHFCRRFRPYQSPHLPPEIGAETAPGSCDIPPTAICPHAIGGLTFRRHSGASRNLTLLPPLSSLSAAAFCPRNRRRNGARQLRHSPYRNLSTSRPCGHFTRHSGASRNLMLSPPFSSPSAAEFAPRNRSRNGARQLRHSPSRNLSTRDRWFDFPPSFRRKPESNPPAAATRRPNHLKRNPAGRHPDPPVPVIPVTLPPSRRPYPSFRPMPASTPSPAVDAGTFQLRKDPANPLPAPPPPPSTQPETTTGAPIAEGTPAMPCPQQPLSPATVGLPTQATPAGQPYALSPTPDGRP